MLFRSAHLEAYKKFKEDNPDAVHYLERAGVNLYTATLNSRNYNNFRLQVATTINDTIMGMRQAIFARENGSALQFIKQAAYGLRDPSIVRDMAYSTMLTMGFGAVDSLGVALEAAATRTAGTAATTAASRTLTAIGAGAVKNLGPMTGLIEGPTFNLLKSTLFKKAGEKFAHTLAARGGAIFVEGATVGSIAAAANQKAEYDFRKMVFHNVDHDFKYDYNEILTSGAIEIGRAHV